MYHSHQLALGMYVDFMFNTSVCAILNPATQVSYVVCIYDMHDQKKYITPLDINNVGLLIDL